MFNAFIIDHCLYNLINADVSNVTCTPIGISKIRVLLRKRNVTGATEIGYGGKSSKCMRFCNVNMDNTCVSKCFIIVQKFSIKYPAKASQFC